MISTARQRPLFRAGAGLALLSFVILFQELTLIRWLPGEVRVLAYFPNLTLLSAFLGLGVGCLRARKASLLWLWPASLLALVAAHWFMSGIAFTENSVSEHLYLLYYDLGRHAPVVNDLRPPIAVSFLLSAACFVPPGQLLAVRLDRFREAGRPLIGYACDLLGSLAGVIAFAVVSFAYASPPWWFAVFLVASLPFFRLTRRSLLVYAGIAIAVIAMVRRADRAQYYSPYYAISVRRLSTGAPYAVLVNGSLHQYVFELRRDRIPASDPIEFGYHLPYRLLERPPRRVLVLGAGTGNDVAVALDEGARHVDAVEIDPIILRLGRLHPDQPYASPRVRCYNTDARAFLNNSTAKYDLIVFGTLDSMTRLSALSNVRLDNFVYTQECVDAARAHLAPDGGIVMYFMSATPYIDRRLDGLLTHAFDRLPRVAIGNFTVFNRIFLAGPAFDHVPPEQPRLSPAALHAVLARVNRPEDDWPYLYLAHRTISSFYLELIGFIAAVAMLAVALASHEMRTSLGRGRIDAEMFLFGLGFLLLETKSVTTMSLLWGATWLTSAVVFGAILAMILGATLLSQWRPWPWSWCLVALAATLLLAHAVPVHDLLRMAAWPRLLVSISYVGVPIFFAALCFALLFRERPDAGAAFGWNLLGAVTGGLLEYLSMITGLRALYLLVAAAYLGAALVRTHRRRALPRSA